MGNLQPLPAAGVNVSSAKGNAMRLKPVRARKLRNGAWVTVAEGSDPLVVPADIARRLTDPANPGTSFSDLHDILSDAGFLSDPAGAPISPPPSAPQTPGWKVARICLWAVGVLLATIATTLLIGGGVPTGADLVSAGPNAVLTVIVALAIAAITAVPHELAHVVFGRASSSSRGSVQVNVRRAFATTELTHVWTWPLPARLAAVSAGLVVDFAFLVAALTVRTATGWWVATVAVAVLVMRIVWQARFHRTSDGRHIAKMLLDNPLIKQDARSAWVNRRTDNTPTSVRLWAGLIAVGFAAEATLLLVWFVPAVLVLIGML